MDFLKHLGDLLSYSVILATLAKILPPLAAAFSIAWIIFQFWHSEPMRNRRERKRQEKLNGL